MRLTKTTVLITVLLFSFIVTTYGILSQGSLSNATTQSMDWWIMYRHDPEHTGYSTSTAPNTNQTLWIAQFGDWVRSSPTVHNNIVFIGADDGNSGTLHALNAATGEQIWNYTAGGDVVSSAAVSCGRVYFGSCDNKFYCVDETNGDFLWSFQTGHDIRSSPCVAENKVVFGSDDWKLYCLDANTGSHLWNFSAGGKIESSPAVADGKVFFGSLDSKVYALNLTSGMLIWNYTAGASITISPSVVDGRVFTASYKTVCCLNASDADLLWTYTAGAAVYSSPAIAGGKVYFGCKDHKMYCLNALNGQFRWTFTTGDEIYSSPAVADGKVFFGSNDNKVYCLNADIGALIWSYDTGGKIRLSSPAVATTFVFVASSYYPPFSGKLFAFGRLENTPPVAENLTLTPSSPVTTDSLIANYDYYDENEDPESGTAIRWYKSDILQSGYNDQLEIPSHATTKGETWYFTVKPKDGREFGELKTSSAVIIQNSPPVIDSYYPSIDPTIAEGESQEFNITISDPDLDALTVEWYLNGTKLEETSTSYTYTTDSGSASIYNVTVTVSDGQSKTNHEWFLTINPKIRDVAITNVTLSKTIVGQGYPINVSVTIENQGEVTETFNVSLHANTTIVETKEITLSSGNSTTITVTWNTTGWTKGSYTISAIADQVLGETDTTDNTLVDGTVLVTFPGDVNGDGKVRVDDVLAVALAFGSNLGDPNYNPNLDVNGDDKIRVDDVLTAVLNFGEGP